MCQVHEELTHTLVEYNRIALLHELADDLALLILDNQDLDGSTSEIPS